MKGTYLNHCRARWANWIVEVCSQNNRLNHGNKRGELHYPGLSHGKIFWPLARTAQGWKQRAESFYILNFSLFQRICWAGGMAQRVTALTALLKVLSSNPTPTWWLTTTCNKIWRPLLVCLKTATVYLCILINKFLGLRSEQMGGWVAGGMFQRGNQERGQHLKCK